MKLSVRENTFDPKRVQLQPNRNLTPIKRSVRFEVSLNGVSANDSVLLASVGACPADDYTYTVIMEGKIRSRFP